VGPIQLDLSDVEIVDEVITLDDGDIAVLDAAPRRRLPAPRRAAARRPAVAFDDAPTRVFAMHRAPATTARATAR
jgi:hypothetical protein